MNTKVIIGLHGYTGVGKDEIAKHLVAKHGFTRVAFADAMRNGLLALDPWIWDPTRDEYLRLSAAINRDGWDWAKRNIPDVRTYLQRFGTEAGRDIHGLDCWTQAASAKIESAHRVVVTDVRFLNEVWKLMSIAENESAELEIWRVEREGHAAISSHQSECAIKDEWITTTLCNNGSIDELHKAVDDMFAAILPLAT